MSGGHVDTEIMRAWVDGWVVSRGSDGDDIHTFWATPRPRKSGVPGSETLWPLSTDHSPNLVGLAEPREVRAAICAAQLAAVQNR